MPDVIYTNASREEVRDFVASIPSAIANQKNDTWGVGQGFRSRVAGTFFGLVAENIFNADWNEAQFATESRLFDEPEAVEELHFTPGTPFFLKGKIAYNF